VRKLCLDMVYELAKQDERIVFIGSDLGFGTLRQFKEEMPERFFMEGISEANVVGMAAGLAMEGNIVYVNTIATFLTRRCFEQVAMDVCLHHANVRLIGNGGGLVYAPLGPTHEAIEDIAIFRALPGMTIVAPADREEMRRFMPQTVEYRGPIYIRLGKGNEPVISSDAHTFTIGRAIAMREGDDALMLTTGVSLHAVVEAAEMLARQGIEATVLHLPTVKPLDEKAILHYAARVPVIVSVEEHSVIGGLGGAVAELIAETSFSGPKRFKRLGIPDEFAHKYGSQADLQAYYGLTAKDIVKEIAHGTTA